ARAKRDAVKQILDQLLGPKRELAFGEPSKPKFYMPAPQINATTSQAEAKPIADAARTVSASPKPHATEQNQKVAVPGSNNKLTRGRPRKDDIARMICELHAKKKPWQQIADEVKRKFPDNEMSADACRKLWESRNKERPKNKRR